MEKTQHFSPDSSAIRLVLFLKNAETKVYHSIMNEDKKGVENSILGMTRRLINKKHVGTVKTAVFYENTTGAEIRKMVF